MTDQLIQPAPAYSSIAEATSADQKRKLEDREKHIKALQKNLRIMTRIAEPLQQAMQLEQHCLSPQLRIILRSNQLASLALGFKGIFNAYIDDAYLEIEDPPTSLKENVERGHTTLDALVQIYIDSMMDVITYIQNQHPTSEYTRSSSRSASSS